MAHASFFRTEVYTDFMQEPRLVRADWDSGAGVWVATSDDVPGLVTESDTVESLADKLQHLVPELLHANGADVGGDITYELLARRLSIAPNPVH